MPGQWFYELNCSNESRFLTRREPNATLRKDSKILWNHASKIELAADEVPITGYRMWAKQLNSVQFV